MTGVIVELRDVFCVHRSGQGDAAALQGVELGVRAGEVLCVLGPSGAGKSTLLRVIAGLQTPSAGIVRVMGNDIGRQRERARAALRHLHLGVLGQSSDNLLSPELSIARAVELPLALRATLDDYQRKARVAHLLNAVGLSDRAQARPCELSGGERQRIALCVAVAHRPALLLADEPTAELDQANAEQVLQLIGRFAAVDMMSAIIATHDEAASGFSDRTVTLSAGRIAEERQDGDQSVVVSQTGWMRIPPRVRAAAEIGDRARVEASAAGVLVRAAAPGPTSAQREAEGLAHMRLLEPVSVEFRAVELAYERDRRVLTGVSHAFAPGQITAITGRSGSGKSTLLRLIAGLAQPDSGEVIVAGHRLGALDLEEIASLRRRHIGYMPQEPGAIAFLSALENLILVQQIRGTALHEAVRSAKAILKALALSQRATQLAARLSAGEIQRVALGRALACARGLLVLDEPTSRLDEANARLVADLLAQARRAGQTVICATHDPAVIDCADDVFALDDNPTAARETRARRYSIPGRGSAALPDG